MNKFTFRWLISAVNIRTDSDKEYAISNLKENIYIKGANLWYLVSSAILASIGLDTNSPAVIIGAMLISPLMSPILGIGLSVGIYDKELLIASFKEFVFAIMISLFISTVYFVLSPLGSATTELVARTTPTLLDIGIALFGGMAGIVAGTRKGMATSIPGVAIATALMPPICTAGYGIASGDPYYFGGAYYLFFINAVFISLSAVLIIRYLKFPVKKYLDRSVKSRIRRLILLFVFIVSVPSSVIFYGIIKDANEQKKIKTLIAQNFDEKNRSVLNWKLIKSDTTKTLRIFYTGDVYRAEEEDTLQQILNSDFGSMGLRLQHLDQAYKIESIENRIDTDIGDKLEVLLKDKSLLEARVKQLETGITLNLADSLQREKMMLELSMFYPSITGIQYLQDSLSSLTVTSTKKRTELLSIADREKLERYIRSRTGSDSLKVVFK